MERYLRVNLLGPGPRLMKKEFTGPRSHKDWHWLTSLPGRLTRKFPIPANFIMVIPRFFPRFARHKTELANHSSIFRLLTWRVELLTRWGHLDCIACLEPDGTRWRTGAEVKGKDANGVGSQQPCTVRRNTVYTIAVGWSALLDRQ